jgi:predicted aspartyl protease
MRIILLSSFSGRLDACALRRFAVGLFLLLPFWGGQLWAQDTIYSWTDEKGVVHFSNSMAPPQHLKEAAVAAAPSYSPVREAEVREATDVPLVLLNNDPSQKFVRTILEGERRSREALMLVDTGAQITVIDEEMAQELDVEHVQDALLAGVTGVSKGWIGRLPTLRIGEDAVNDLHVMVGPMAGRLLLGMDVLEQLGLSVGLRNLHRASR